MTKVPGCELITMEEGTWCIAPKVLNDIATFEREVARIKKQEDELKAKLLKEMIITDIKQIQSADGELTITKIDPTERETFDTKRFREEHPDLYDEYVKFSTVKSSVRIKLG